MKTSSTVESSKVTLTELMLPSHSNFRGKIHGGYILNLMDQIAFASASKYSGCYCVTASVDRVDFLNPIEIGELLTLKASVNYVGNSSMVIGIRVDSENIQTGIKKHCNSSYFTMVAKDDNGNKVKVPTLKIQSFEEIRRFFNALQKINHHRNLKNLKDEFDFASKEALEKLQGFNVLLDL